MSSSRMSEKTLSNSTLSLRFMQNAQRAKLQAQVEAEQAKIKDEAEWEVSKEVKEAWGIGSSGSDAQRSVTHETSYLPFLFSQSEGDADGLAAGPSRVRGRRTFDDRGQETIPIPQEKDDAKDAGETVAPPADAPDQAKSAIARRPTSISGFKTQASSAQKSSKKAKRKTAQMLIRESAAFEPPASLLAALEDAQEAPGREPATAPAPAPAGFMKPAGVDEPASRPAGVPSTLKREREQSQDSSVLGSAKRKKKKADVS